MLSAMRKSTKVIMWIVMATMVVWLVFQVGMNVTGRGNTGSRDVGSVNGTPIPYTTYMESYRAAYDQARQENPGVNFTREEVRDIENQAFNNLVQDQLLKEEYHRRGIVVTDREIVDAVRRSPPQEILRSPDFQTNGQFDPNKYERFLGSSNANTRQYLLAMEARYREELPRYKLLQAITSDVYVPDAKLWTIWRDTHESLTVRVLNIGADAVPVTGMTASDSEIAQYYNAHKNEFREPARAKLSFVAISKLPNTVDSLLLIQHIRAVRDSLLHGADFATVARNESSDSVSARNGGSLGTFGRGAMDPAFERAAFSLPIGTVSEPVFSAFGIHLIKVEKRTADSVTARHILFPYARFGARLDSLESKADSLDRQAADQTDPTVLDSVARRMDLVIQHPDYIRQGVPYVLGRYRIPDVGVWAFEAHVGETSPVVETSGAYYVFRLDSTFAAGVPPLDQVKDRVRLKVLTEKRRAAAEAMAKDAERRMAAGKTMDQVAQEMNLTVRTLGPYTRTATWPLLGGGTAAVGAAFRLRLGERSGMMSNDQGYFFLQAERRVPADSTAWAAQKDQQRAQVIRAARQLRVQSFVQALQREAHIKDRRAEVIRPASRDQNATN